MEINIYIITDNNYFSLGIREKLKLKYKSIYNLSIKELEGSPKKIFKRNDVFIFYISDYSLQLSFLISTGHLPEKLIFISKNKNLKLNSTFKNHIFLDAHASPELISKKIDEECKFGVKKNHKEQLTEREGTILYHTINGMSAQKIGKFLSISSKTVYTHRRNAFHKLGGRNLFEIWPIKEHIIMSISNPVES